MTGEVYRVSRRAKAAFGRGALDGPVTTFEGRISFGPFGHAVFVDPCFDADGFAVIIQDVNLDALKLALFGQVPVAVFLSVEDGPEIWIIDLKELAVAQGIAVKLDAGIFSEVEHAAIEACGSEGCPGR